MQPFIFTLDRDRALLRVELHGFWDLATMDSYEPQFHQALAELDSLGAVRTSCLVDARDYPVQSHAITERQNWFVAKLGPLQADRAALIVATTLVRMQAARGLPEDRMRVFESETEALAWLGCAPEECAPEWCHGTPEGAIRSAA